MGRVAISGCPIVSNERFATISESSELFTWLNKQGVRSELGFSLQFTGRFSAEYGEGSRVVTLDIESGMTGGLPCIILDPDAFRKWDDGSPISAAEQLEKFRHVENALAFQKLKMVIQAGTQPPEQRS